MNRDEVLTWLALVAIMALAGVVCYLFLEEERDCRARGGELLRGLNGNLCVEVKRLK